MRFQSQLLLMYSFETALLLLCLYFITALVSLISKGGVVHLTNCSNRANRTRMKCMSKWNFSAALKRLYSVLQKAADKIHLNAIILESSATSFGFTFPLKTRHSS